MRPDVTDGAATVAVHGANAPADSPDDRLRHNVAPADWSNPTPADRYDLVILGAGTGGLVTAAIASALGARVALVERHAMGGDCLNVGCVPSKAILRDARAWHEARVAAVRFGGPQIAGDGDFALAMQRMRRVRAAISATDSAARFRDMGVDVFFGDARFTARDQVGVNGATLRFRRAVIATGSRPRVPAVPGLADVPYHTNETIFDLRERPRRLVVLGGGSIGCELAQAFQRLGSDVSLLESGPRLLGHDDADAAAVVAASLARDGVRVRTGVSVERASRDGDAIRLDLSGAEAVIGDHLLIATGRAPSTDGLELERAGVAFDRHGVTTDARLRTTNHRVFAVGDVTGRPAFTHMADAEARLAVQNALFFGRASADALIVPWCTYTDPELAHVGPAPDAVSRMRGVRAITIPLHDVDRARLDAEDDGFFRVHVDQRGRIVAATFVGPHAGDIISAVTGAMVNGLPLAALGRTIFPYPTYAEALRKAADADRRRALTPSRQRWIAGVLRVLRRLP